ncbi:ATP-binding protein [Candidatus Parcubacteria bacterium]|nr:ATP-binding protein [Patescibacteria group bacterium]MBU4381288.1 ATP-binding protein [Patescibacteria group bacterium]MCG2689005.1 ATP-binding protein [Candidatus Parcubacteria bacterium]
MKNRYLLQEIIQDVKEKIVLLGGPRQVGKTTLSKQVGKFAYPNFSYFNWDYQPDRKDIVGYRFPAKAELLIFDELHKFRHWKTYIKGLFDRLGERHSFLVTGSAKMDLYRRGGDSLSGRCRYYVLHPFSLVELTGSKGRAKPFEELHFVDLVDGEKILQRLSRFGPFPEPFSKRNITFWRRWQSDRVDRLIKEEIRDLRYIGDVSTLQILADLLPEKVGSLLSVNALCEDLQVAYKTVANYLAILELFYYHFRLSPFRQKMLRSLKKMTKLYLWDWSVLSDESARFENLVAGHLLKFVHYLRDVFGFRSDLYYLRDAEGREVDFLVAVDNKPWFAVEAKLSDTIPSSHLNYFGARLRIPFLYQVVFQPKIDIMVGNVRVISADKFLTAFV